MRTTIPLQSTVSRNRIAPESSPASALNRLTVLAAILSAGPLLFGVPALTAQAPSASSAAHVPSTAAHKSAHAHSRPSPRHPQTPPTQTPPETVVLPPPPEIPHWPANEQPAEAFVAWDSQGLRINAANSSLEQIMKDVSTATGAKVEGLGNDQRVFGAYGPGQARDVLSQLLQGSGYNVLMIGDQGQGAPREIMLTLRQAAGAHGMVLAMVEVHAGLPVFLSKAMMSLAYSVMNLSPITTGDECRPCSPNFFSATGSMVTHLRLPSRS